MPTMNPTPAQWKFLNSFVTGALVNHNANTVLACMERGWVAHRVDADGDRELYLTPAGQIKAANPCPVDRITEAVKARKAAQRKIHEIVAKYGREVYNDVVERPVEDWSAWGREQRKAARAAAK